MEDHGLVDQRRAFADEVVIEAEEDGRDFITPEQLLVADNDAVLILRILSRPCEHVIEAVTAGNYRLSIATVVVWSIWVHNGKSIVRPRMRVKHSYASLRVDI